ncbi:DUF1272 domain-containing protein [Streptomyces sp. NPDC045431]|uniref:DUF1272 domain-containing protein n=1 Tax=Streptomyces sp. NPDC045431 TaxID=3155613 RepID=UPI0033C28BCD
MALDMRELCERCERPVSATGAAYICSYECTFCEPCTTAMNHICPNCGGDLVLRPTRTKPASD